MRRGNVFLGAALLISFGVGAGTHHGSQEVVIDEAVDNLQAAVPLPSGVERRGTGAVGYPRCVGAPAGESRLWNQIRFAENRDRVEGSSIMKEIRNTTRRPLRVPLPQGKTLHLGPLHTGEVAASALDHPPFQELVESGEIEVLGEGEPESRHPFKEETGPAEPSP